MKKYFLAFTFVIAYAIFLSLGFVCLLNLLGVAMAISLDGAAVTKQYPRFIPFCLITGILAVVTLVVIFISNLKVSKKVGISQKIRWAQVIIVAIGSIAMIKLWELLFDFLQRTF